MLKKSVHTVASVMMAGAMILSIGIPGIADEGEQMTPEVVVAPAVVEEVDTAETVDETVAEVPDSSVCIVTFQVAVDGIAQEPVEKAFARGDVLTLPEEFSRLEEEGYVFTWYLDEAMREEDILPTDVLFLLNYPDRQNVGRGFWSHEPRLAHTEPDLVQLTVVSFSSKPEGNPRNTIAKGFVGSPPVHPTTCFRIQLLGKYTGERRARWGIYIY